MELKEFINKLEGHSAADIVEYLCENNIPFAVFSEAVRKNGGWDSADRRKNVQLLLKQKDDGAYNATVAVNTAEAFNNYLSLFPAGSHLAEAKTKIQQIQNARLIIEKKIKDREKMLREIKEDINEYTPDEILERLNGEVLNDLCTELGIDTQIIIDYKEPPLIFNDIPQTEEDIPSGYTDVFFWGINTSGKTCALSAIFNTINKEFSLEAPKIEKQFGATYRDSLTNIFRNDVGYLPGRTNTNRTQYIPFQLYRRGERNNRKISFFELSGEVVKYFYEIVNRVELPSINRDEAKVAFQALNLVLRSNNQKIHYFFIDYNREMKNAIDENGLSQSQYLTAASVYFRDNNDIFKKKTDAVYVIVTKSDEIKSNDRIASAKSFLRKYFGDFMDILDNQCNKNSVEFKVKIFSIGDVYFKRICKINRDYSRAIINDLITRVKPVSNCILRNILNR